MRITIVVTSATTAQRFVLGFAESLTQRGHEVCILCDDAASLAQSPRHNDVELRPIPSLSRDPHPLQDVRSLTRLVRELRALRPDLVTYATPKASLLAATASALLRVRVRHYQLWGLRLETTHGMRRALMALFELLTRTLSTSISANSSSLATAYRALRPAPPHEIHVLGAGSSHGVDLQHFSPEAQMPPLDCETQQFVLAGQQDLVVGFVGRFHPDKGIDTMFAAASLATQRGVNLKLLLLGADEGAQIPRTPLPPSTIRHVGRVDDPRPYMKAMDVLLLPSRREGFPNVVLEAAALGVPAIVSDCTGAVDSVVPEVTGIVVPTDDVEATCEAIVRLAQAPTLRKRLGKSAQEWVRQHFRQEEVWALHADLFAQLDKDSTTRRQQ